MSHIESRSQVRLGVVPTHLKFVGGLVPDDDGKMPRDDEGNLIIAANLQTLVSQTSVKFSCAQISYFPGLDDSDVAELVEQTNQLGLEIQFVLMVGGADPMNPADEDKVVEMLVAGLKAAQKHGVKHVASTSVEAWMVPGATPKQGSEFDAAVAQNVKLHLRAAQEAEVDGSCIEAWHVEFLRSGEFQTFTDVGKIWEFVRTANQQIGRSFFKVMIDAAHCGDSDLTIQAHEKLIQEIADAGALGIFHASAKTTRGCLSTDDGWVAALLTACAQTGHLEMAYVELFHHEDPALEGLRQYDPRHGVDTTDGRTYDQTVLDALETVGRQLNNLVARGILSS